MTKERVVPPGASNRDVLTSDSEEQAAFVDLVRASSRLEAEMNRVFRPYDLTTATYAILRILESATDEGLSCGDISTQLIAEVPDMTRLLDRLERLEYVYRERSSIDRRMVRVKITNRGRAVIQGLKAKVLECHKGQFSQLGTEGVRRLQALLQLLGRLPSPSLGSEEGHEPEKRGVIGL